MHAFITESWDEYLETIPDVRKDIYFYEEYVKLYENNECPAFCFICIDDENILLLPFIRKKILGYFDFETPYGYGGPISNTENTVWIQRALKSFSELLYKKKYIAGFIRFHPLLENHLLCNFFDMQIILDRKTVSIDLSVPKEKIWQEQITSKNRNMIRKAEKSGLEYITDIDFKYIDAFTEQYDQTMNRLDADSFYYFSSNYYERFVDKLKKKSFLGIVKLNNQVISAAIFMYSQPYGHYHLAGSNRNFSSMGLNNFLLWNAALALKEKEVKHFHLGGGTNNEPENSLLKFKTSFSSNTNNFYIGKIIINNDIYNKICTDWEKKNPEKKSLYKNYLLKYRY